MKDASFFFDTNILLYLLSGDIEKAACVEAIVSKGGIISVQVLNEFASVASRKLGLSYAEIREFLVTIRAVCDVRPLTVETHLLGLGHCGTVWLFFLRQLNCRGCNPRGLPNLVFGRLATRPKNRKQDGGCQPILG